MNIRPRPDLIYPVFLLLLITSVDSAAASYDGFRWFQIEISIFSNEYPEYRSAELWSPDRLELKYPDRAREFKQLADILQLEDFGQRVLGNLPVQLLENTGAQTPADQVQEASAPAKPVGPFPRKPPTELRLLDQDRDSFLLLPPSLSDFQTTNSRLESSPFNRLLFHGVWRQPVVQPDDSSPLIIRGGRQVGLHHELEGTITIRFNPNEDRVVIDTNLWLTEFSNSGANDPDWELPSPPGSVPSIPDPDRTESPSGATGISRIVQMQQSRDMRSTEFHYLDHPAMGLVIRVLPYDLPPPVSLEFPDTATQLDSDL